MDPVNPMTPREEAQSLLTQVEHRRRKLRTEDSGLVLGCLAFILRRLMDRMDKEQP